MDRESLIQKELSLLGFSLEEILEDTPHYVVVAVCSDSGPATVTISLEYDECGYLSCLDIQEH